jgi:type I restriction-modification system DNA methylase subunit
LLAENIAKRNLNLSEAELNFAIQMIIDRIIFLRICEDRGIENYEELKNITKQENIYSNLVNIFEKADDKYNSGLFHFKNEKDRIESPDQITPTLNIDDKVLKNIIKSLYYPDCPYELSVISSDVLGNVYERFLGKVITLSKTHKANIDLKPEVKKAGGVYYTPNYVVEYIVKNTIGESIADKTPSQVKKIKILDPACGSGSFLIEAYQFLLDWHLNYYTTNETDKWLKGKTRKLFKSKTGLQLTLSERKNILLNNVFGVDIDKNAVEVTKLSLLLKVLEYEGQEIQQKTLFQERILPDLYRNIKCGNSLIGSEYLNKNKDIIKLVKLILSIGTKSL